MRTVVPGGVCRRRSRRGSGRSGSSAARRPTRVRGPSSTVSSEWLFERATASNSRRSSRARAPRSRFSRLELDATGVEPGEVEQIGRELRQPRRPARGRCRGTPSACPSSRSSSSSSSRKPPSEKIGVRSSCDALAMNSRRARSSPGEPQAHPVERRRQLRRPRPGPDRRSARRSGRSRSGRRPVRAAAAAGRTGSAAP